MANERLETLCRAAREAAGATLCEHGHWDTVCPTCQELAVPRPKVNPRLAAAIEAAQKEAAKERSK